MNALRTLRVAARAARAAVPCAAYAPRNVAAAAAAAALARAPSVACMRPARMFTAGADAVEQANAEFKAGIKNELKAAMKGGDKAATAVLKSLLSDLTYAEKSPQDKGVSAVTILRRSIKRRQESAASFRAGARDDLAVAEEAEAAILERFLPKQMSEDEIAAVVAQVRDRIGAKGAGDLGKVMKVLNAEIDASVAPRKLVSEVAKRVLSA